jgi:hypothetical protein
VLIDFTLKTKFSVFVRNSLSKLQEVSNITESYSLLHRKNSPNARRKQRKQKFRKMRTSIKLKSHGGVKVTASKMRQGVKRKLMENSLLSNIKISPSFNHETNLLISV